MPNFFTGIAILKRVPFTNEFSPDLLALRKPM
jgi:hypothetical protein